MLKFHWSVALRRATSAGVLMSALGTGLAAFGQNGLPHPPDAPAATVPPAPTGEAPPAAEPAAEEPAAEEPAAEEEEETEDEPACDFLMRLFDDECGNNFLDDHGLKIPRLIEDANLRVHVERREGIAIEAGRNGLDSGHSLSGVDRGIPHPVIRSPQAGDSAITGDEKSTAVR